MNTKIRSLFAATLTAGALLSVSAFSASAFAATTMTMEATAYGLTAQDNYPYGATDYFGQPLTVGDIAVDPSVIPLGTCLYVTGYSSPYLPKGGFVGEADDTGGAIQGEHIDIFENLDNESEISNFGIQEVKVTILGKSPDSPSQASGTAACAEYESGAGATSGSQGQASSGAQTGSSQGASGAGAATGSAAAGANAGRPARRHDRWRRERHGRRDHRLHA